MGGEASVSPLMERVHWIQDMILEHSKLRKLVSHTHFENKLGYTPNQVEHAVRRGLQLYPDTKEIKPFGAYRYY